MMASQVTIVEIVPAIARLPVEKKAPIRGVMRVVPQVGQPAPRAMRPVMMPARSRLAAFCFFFLCQRRTIRPMRIPCNKAIQKTGNQSRKGWPMPKMARKLSLIMRSPSGKPRSRISSNLERPPARRFMRRPNKRKAGMKPYQKRFSFVASRIPLPARTKPSSHLLQFINTL